MAAKPRVIAVMNQTHDVGKTFITANLAYALTAQGKSVLLIDMDPQADLSRSFQVPATQPGLSEYLQGTLTLPEVSLAITDQLTLIGTGVDLASFDHAEKDKMARGRQLLNRLSDGEFAGFDLLLLDCAAVSGLLGSNAVLAASDMLLPVTGDAPAMQGMLNMLPVIRRVSQRRSEPLRVWLCLNRLPRGNAYAEQLAAMLNQYFPKRLLRTMIYEADEAQTTVYQSLAQDLLAGRTSK